MTGIFFGIYRASLLFYIKIVIEEIWCEFVDLIYLTQNIIELRAVVNKVMILRNSIKGAQIVQSISSSDGMTGE
jgi:hypothetical protein